MKTIVNVVAFSILGLTPLAAASHGGMRVREIDGRHASEQKRISHDFTKGELTASQDKKLESREAHIKKAEGHDRHQDEGHLTKSDFQELKRDENHISRTIRHDKHG